MSDCKPTNPSLEVGLIRDLIATGIQPVDRAVIVPTGYQLTDIEKFEKSPYRLRGSFNTRDLAEFGDFVRAEGNEARTAIFVDPDNFQAVARFDHGNMADPGWAEFRARLSLQKTPEYEAFLSICDGQPMKQEPLVDWILDWRDGLEFTASQDIDDFDPMPLAAALQSIRKLETSIGKAQTHQSGDLAAQRTTLEHARISSEPPARMRMRLAPYREFGDTTLTARMVYTPSDPPAIRIRPVGLDAKKDEFSRCFSGLIRDRLGDGWRVHIGTFS